MMSDSKVAVQSQNISDIYSITDKTTSLNQQSISNKGNKMSSINVQAIINLADTTLKNDFEELGIDIQLPENISAHLEDLRSEEKEKAEREAAQEIYTLLKATNKYLTDAVSDLRHIRSSEARIKSRIKDIETARQYGLQTTDFRPLLRVLGMTHIDAKVPEDFVPKNNVTTAKTVGTATARKTFTKSTTRK